MSFEFVENQLHMTLFPDLMLKHPQMHGREAHKEYLKNKVEDPKKSIRTRMAKCGNRHWWNVHITLTYSIHFNLAFRKCVKRIFGWNHECISIEIEMEVEWEISCLLDISLRLSSTLYNVQNMVNNFPTLFQLTSTWLSLNEMTVPFCYIKHFVAIRMEKR